MSRSLKISRRRTAAASGLVLTAVAALAGCGSDTGSDEVPTEAGLAAVSITGDFGSEPKVEWKARMTADDVEAKVLVEGDGAEIADADEVFTRMYVGNGYTEAKVYSTFGEGTVPDVLPVGSDLSAALKQAVEGRTLGSRVAVAASSTDAFGEGGNPQMGIGNADTVLFVVDLIDTMPDGPEGTPKDPAGWAPKINEKDGVPSALDFTGKKKAGPGLKVSRLITGDGPATEDGQTLYVNYLGQVFGGKEPFDSSFAKGQVFPFALGQGEVVKGWDQGLKGVPVGSRVVIAVPPDLGYGEQGNPDAGIKGTDTLYFVVDVLAAL